MADDKNENVVIAIFGSEEAANSAIDGLKQWDKVNDEIKLGAIGTITKDGEKVKTHVGRRAGRGAAIGATVGVIGAVLSGGLTLIGGAVAGTALGGATGAFFKKSVHLTKEEVQQIGSELEGGKVAVVVTCDDYEVEPTSEYLQGSGGKVRSYTIPTEAVDDAAEAMKDTAAMPSEDDQEVVFEGGEPVAETPAPDGGESEEEKSA